MASGDRHGSHTHPEFRTIGERNGMAKLSWNDVNKIRQLYVTGKYTQQKLSQRFNVSRPHISGIVNLIYWH
jgi:hypothetical protein